MEVKGDGGYVVFPPSQYQLGDRTVRYSVGSDDDPAAAPPWLYGLILAARDEPKGNGAGAATGEEWDPDWVKKKLGWICELVRSAEVHHWDEARRKLFKFGKWVGGGAMPVDVALRGVLTAAKANATAPPDYVGECERALLNGVQEPEGVPENPSKAKAKARKRGARPNTGCADLSMTEKGLWWRDAGKDEWLRVSQSFEVVGRCRTGPDAIGRDDEWGVVIRFSNADGKSRKEIISASSFHSDIAVLCGELARKGMDIEPNERARRLFVKYLSAANTSVRMTRTRAYGWNAICGQRAFVLPSGPISAGALGERVLPPDNVDGKIESRGTLNEWKVGVGQQLSPHTIGVLMCAAAFAGPLLELGGYEPGGIHVYGPSSTGKSSLLCAAASVWGKGSLNDGCVRSWRATDNALEAVLSGANDMALFLDELGQVNEDQAHHVVYMTASGQGKARMDGQIQLRPSFRWRTVMISTGEITVQQKLAEARWRKVRAGQLVRILDIPAQRGRHGAFDGDANFDSAACAKQLRQAAVKAYGVAGPAFVKALVDRGRSGEQVRQRVNAWIEARNISSSHGQADRVAERLGVIAVAGELAIEFGIVPWQRGAASDAAAWALFEWLKSVGARPFEEQQAIAQIRGMIERYGDSRFDNMEANLGDREDLEPKVREVTTKCRRRSPSDTAG
jgi:uncharacterized protein (DUF927 family)